MFHRLIGVLYLLCSTTTLMAATIDIPPAEWGAKEGEGCISCHTKASGSLVKQWQQSAHGREGVNCFDCHRADSSDSDALEHEGEVIATIVSPADCGRCHSQQVDEFKISSHATARLKLEQTLPAANHPTLDQQGCASCHGSRITLSSTGIPEREHWPNNGIGRVNPDGSLGSCSACHNRHGFSKAQARDPVACSWCHRGSDSPDHEVYAASMHGTLFQSRREQMNLDSESWELGSDYHSAPTCVTCHMGAAPGIKASHDATMRSAWELGTPVSHKQSLVIFADGDRMEVDEIDSPRRGDILTKLDGSSGTVKAIASADRRRQVMSKVCLECHGKEFTNAFMANFDNFIERYNRDFGQPAKAIMDQLYAEGALTPTPLDELLEQTYWQLWHEDGITARHGAAMASSLHSWNEGLHRVQQLFDGPFTQQLIELIGAERAQTLLQRPTQPPPLIDRLGRVSPSSPAGEASAEVK
ncbi:hypothetical protein D5085_06920 [Ectothiorhodospiraceae bacterium BW-2]|nr:hypothetical protein D5085_06920 [Ectothiorhodospiraceae bacterium BW-2]